MKVRYLLAAAVLFVTACTKDETTKDNCTEGTIRFTNNSNNTYRVYINGALKDVIPGKKFNEFKLPKGVYGLKAEQSEGYVLYPTIRTTDVSIKGCDEHEFVFP